MSRMPRWLKRLFWIEIRSAGGGFRLLLPRRWLARILHWGH